MVKWTAVIIPLALATAAYLFYSRHQGSAASTASRNEDLPEQDKDDKVDKIKNITIRSQVLNPHFFGFFSTGPSSAAAAKTTATTTAWKQS